MTCSQYIIIISLNTVPRSSSWSLFSSPSLLWLQPGSGLTVLQCMELLCLLGNVMSPVSRVPVS